MKRTLMANQTEHDIPELLESFLEKQYDLYPHDLEQAMLEAIRKENDNAAELAKSFLQQYFKLRYSQEMPVQQLDELTAYMIRLVRKTPNDRLLKFLAYTLDSKMKEVNHRTL